MITLIGSYRFVLSRLVGVTLRQLFLDTAPAVVASAALLAVAYPLTEGLAAAGVPVLLLVAVVGVACAPVYLVVLRLASRPAWDDMLLIVRRILVPRPLPQAHTAGGLARRHLIPQPGGAPLRILVTGHHGYIGTLLVPLAQRAGHEVVGLDSDLFAPCVFGAERRRDRVDPQGRARRRGRGPRGLRRRPAPGRGLQRPGRRT